MLKSDYHTEPTEMDTMIFKKLVAEDHYLRRVKATINFARMRELVAECYSPTMGRPGEDPVLMLKLCFLQFQYDLSDRDVIREAQVNIAYRFFLDLSLESALPVASLLVQFRARLGEKRFREVFDEILRQAREQGLVKDRLRLKDATHVIACVAIPATIRLVAQTRERVLKAARRLAPEEVAAQQQRAEQVRETTRELKDQQRLLARVEHLREIVAWADEWQERLRAAVAAGAGRIEQRELREFEAALELAHKVLNDREPKTPDRLCSLVDPEVRTGQHGAFFDGYSLDVSVDADSEMICALDVLAANADEAANAKTLIESEEQTHGNDIEMISMDGIGFRGDILRKLQAEEGPQVEVFVPTWEWPGCEPGLFKPDDFQLNETSDELTCPGRQKTRSRTRANRNRGWQFHFRAAQCANCPLRAQCLKPETQKGRTVIKSDYEAEYAAARQKAQTDKFKEIRKEHPRVERKLGEMIRWHGGRRVRYRGRLRVKIQYFLIGFVVNIKRFVKLFCPSPLPQFT